MRPSPQPKSKAVINAYAAILFASILYAASTVLFIFPNALLLGGTSGISVILKAFLPFSPGSILVAINTTLILLAFIILGKDMAVKTLVGSLLTTAFVGVFEKVLAFSKPIIPNVYISAAIGAFIIAGASGVMFYVDSSSGGTDIIALILKKYSRISIGRALLVTDVLIVIIGGVLSGVPILISSFIGLLIKTCCIDVVIRAIQKHRRSVRRTAQS